MGLLGWSTDLQSVITDRFEFDILHDYRHGAQIRPVLTGTSVEVFKKKELMSPETYRSLADK